jgi:hypothetical protein
MPQINKISLSEKCLDFIVKNTDKFCMKSGGSGLEWHGISNLIHLIQSNPRHSIELVKPIRMVYGKVCANERIPE